ISFDITSQVKGANVTNTGKLEADGGVIELSASSVDDIVTGVINMGGTVAADAGANGQLNVSGAVSAKGANAGETGGSIALTGANVSVAGSATLDASGRAGGGSIKLGGGLHGTDTSIADAQTTTVAAGAVLDASATDKGDGGSVVVWSDKATAVHGTIHAKGGAKGGKGGFVETSSHGHLDIAGAKVDTSAPQGAAGTWLLDPDSVTITDTTSANQGGDGSFTTPFAANDGNTSTLDATQLQNALNTGNVLVQTTDGEIDIAAPIAAPAGTHTNLGLNAG